MRIVAPGLMLLLLLLLGTSPGHALIPEYGAIEAFQFTDHEGRPVSRDALLGRVWVADFIFTRCGGPCPTMTSKLQTLRRKWGPTEDIVAVSFSVDPQYDTPAVLREYARQYEAPGPWLFVTGDDAAIRRLAVESFKLGVNGQGEEVIHSTRMALVDAQGRLRGLYDSEDELSLKRLDAHVRLLRAEQQRFLGVTVARLPAVNAALNGLAALLLVCGYVLIRRGQVGAHRVAMLMAVLASASFLTFYLGYHAHVGSIPFTGRPEVRTTYLSILLLHTVLAAVQVPLIVMTLFRALRNEIPRHRTVARWTLPIWFIVSVTGVIVYYMLYELPGS